MQRLSAIAKILFLIVCSVFQLPHSSPMFCGKLFFARGYSLNHSFPESMNKSSQ